MLPTFCASYIYPPFGRLQLHFSGTQLLQIDLPHQAVLQDAFEPLPEYWQQRLDAYFCGQLREFGEPVSASGTEHDRKVWQAMCAIPYGETRSYGEIARTIGSSAQAVGNACRRNPLPIIVPCHRIVAASGIGGFSGSRAQQTVTLKHWLLQHERTHSR